MRKLWILSVVLYKLLERYKEKVPDVRKIIRAMVKDGVILGIDDIENDHIAFRTMGVPHLGVKSLEKIFLYYGYCKKDYYYFADKKLDAWWYAPPTPEYPRIFISELRVHELPAGAARIIRNYTDQVKADPFEGLNPEDETAVDMLLQRRPWTVPTYTDYLALQGVSEYAAWVLYHGYSLNHFTISVHKLRKGYNSLEKFTDYLEKTGIVLNDSGGKIKISPDGGLKQAATIAAKQEAEFADGVITPIPGSYVEFAERKVLPAFSHLALHEISREHIRDGFEAANADRIFESTYLSQAKKEGL